jgi:hypothetical protein
MTHFVSASQRAKALFENLEVEDKREALRFALWEVLICLTKLIANLK